MIAALMCLKIIRLVETAQVRTERPGIQTGILKELVMILESEMRCRDGNSNSR
jgi:hypothetical protein